MSAMNGRMSLRKNGAMTRPWRVTCPQCPPERLHLTDRGAVVVNDLGVGNRTWTLARLAVDAHLAFHAGRTSG